MNYNLNNVCGILFCATIPFLAISCSEKDDDDAQNRKEQRELQAKRDKKKQEERESLLEKEKQIELAKLKAEEKAAKAKLLKEQEAQEAEQKIADEKESLRQEDILRRQKIQKAACDGYVNTKYAELVLLDGKVLKSAKVTDANPVKVTFLHQNGVARVNYFNLPEEIRLICKYNKELESLELAKRKAIKKERKASLASRPRPTAYKSKTNDSVSKARPSYKRETKSKNANKEKVVRPKGNLSVRVVATQKRGKTIEVIAKSNVDATLYLNNYKTPIQYQVKANKPYRHTWLRVGVKYEVKLTANGKILDKESSGRKSGLGGNGGL